VVHGDVGQTFLYGAKGGTAFIKGNAGGRALINAVGKPRVIINGTCLDYLAESFMAGNPLKDGGFAILNALTIDRLGKWVELENPYPGGNLFSLASGGALYIRDPSGNLSKEQLNGGEFAEVTSEDWALILPYLKENEAHFKLSVEALLYYKGVQRPYEQIYRKIKPAHTHVLQEEEAWVKGG
jgi:glutamate synthase domain-containing protein 3